MHIVVFGLTVSSSWGNGHATVWRSLMRAMGDRGHTLTFFEKDVPYYAATRDRRELDPGCRLVLYDSFEEIRGLARAECDRASLALCTSYCPDGTDACDLILDSRAEIKGFYDLDSPVTLDALASGREVPYLPRYGLAPFDLVLSFTGGVALDELRTTLGARRVAPLYGSVDPKRHYPSAPRDDFRCALSYLGTYSADRQPTLERLFLDVARERPGSMFLVAGSQYPTTSGWAENVRLLEHVAPPDHATFYSSSRATLNVTRAAMARYGYCPSGRLFEAAACGTPILTDWWEGLESFFELSREMLVVTSAREVLEALELSDAELKRMSEAARARVLAEHTGAARVEQLEALCEMVGTPSAS